MPNVIEQQICDAIDVLINKRVANLQFDKTVRATIKSIEDASIGKYLVQYQDSTFYAYSDPDKSYKVGAQVYVEIPSSDFNKTKLIIGSVKKLGEEYLTAVTAEQRMTKIGTNILDNKKVVQFCSYDKSQQVKDGIELLEDYVSVEPNDFKAYKTDKEYLSLGMTVRTALPTEQQVGGGNYGIIMQAEYYTTAQRESLPENERATVIRTYVLDVNNMLGQPYKYILPEYQYAIFAIDGKNLKEITSIKAFCKDFPKQELGHDVDIFLSDFQIYFMQPLSQSELSNSSLKILTPYGSYFTSLNDNTKYLEAELKLKGKKVSFDDQNVDFYWFVKDTNVTAGSQLYYSSLAGQGWRCLNQAQTYNGLTQFTPQRYRKHITPAMAPAKQTTFKCVAVYNGTTLSATIKIGNNKSNTTIEITSSAGTKFYFDTGRTTLTCNVTTQQAGTLLYYWGYRTSDGIFHTDTNTTKSFTTPISVADSFITYECTVYAKRSGEQARIIGSAQITLTNGIPQNEYVLVINNGTKVFKYDEYGVSPASKAVAKEDRILIETLSFDIYDDQGRIVTPLSDKDKVKQCEIKWIWPDTDYTMLQPSDFTLEEDKIINPTTNGYISRQALKNSATLTYKIKNTFDIKAIDNNIRLEVRFQNHSLVASTNFTFIKQGQSGTNGTQYVSRLVPSNSIYERVYLENGNILGWYQTVTKKYDPETGKNDIEDTYTFTSAGNSPLAAQLWDGKSESLYDSKVNTSKISAGLSWQMIDIGRSTTHNAAVNKDSGIITPGTSYSNVSTVVKSTISTDELSDQVKKYYATYPLDVAKTPSGFHAIVTGGFRECMYNNDGTRGSFNTKPFSLKIFQGNISQPITDSKITWTVSWYPAAKNNALKGTNNVTIEPPAMYNSQTTNNYIIVTYDNNSYKIIISVYLYLNRYGLAAMNDWDGTSIKINNQGNQYILAPQIGAGVKKFNSQNQNVFTGVTMGKTFGVNGDANNPQIGLMGFREGIRTIFLDADSGRAIFGSADSGQVVVSPQKYGNAPRGAIYSWDYYKHKTNGEPNGLNNKGMLINLYTYDPNQPDPENDLFSPGIKFGSGNFSVNRFGQLVAQGGGSIAGWKITNTSLESDNGETALYSSDSKNRRIRIGKGAANNPDGTFVVYGDGSFSAANDKFTVTSDGTIVAVDGSIGGWTIKNKSLSSGNITLNSNNNEINVNNKFVIYNDGTFKAANGSFSVDRNGTINASSGRIGNWIIDPSTLRGGNVTLNSNGSLSGQNWNITNGGVATFTDVRISSGNGSSTLNWGSNFSVDGAGNLTANSGNIGGWKLTSAGFSGNGINFTSGGGLSLGSGFSVTPAGSISATSGSIGGWGLSGSSISAGGTSLSSNGTITCANLIATQSGQIGNWSISGGSLTGGGSTLSTSYLHTSGDVQAGGNMTATGYVNAANLYINSVSVLDTIENATANKVSKGTYSGTCSVYGTIDGIPHTFNGSCTINFS